ncbi:hypothetical protein PUN28_012398 [Cardiocondyla obscurior]|uniref:Uncharacterized protein n=1 Tax=Cardiocondyla obscurior TaxID=286306 RepID=A0AAW2FE07_9HYME
MTAFVLRSPASQIHTKSEYSVRETSKRQSIPNPLSRRSGHSAGNRRKTRRQREMDVGRIKGGSESTKRAFRPILRSSPLVPRQPGRSFLFHRPRTYRQENRSFVEIRRASIVDISFSFLSFFFFFNVTASYNALIKSDNKITERDRGLDTHSRFSSILVKWFYENSLLV